MNKKTVMYQITETSLFMMSFVIVTKQDNVVIIDGGRPADMPLLKQYVGNLVLAASIGVLIVVVIRLLASKYRWSLPKIDLEHDL